MLRSLWRRHRSGNTPVLVAVLVAAGLALLGSFVLSIEAIELARSSSASLPCNINAVISCGAVAQHPSSHILGFPNSFIGLMTMPILITIVVILLTGVQLPKWFMRATQVAVVVGVVFAAWMFGMSYLVIQALCPWCMLVDVSMLVIAWGITRYTIRTGAIGGKAAGRWLDRQYDVFALVGVIVLVAAMIIFKFGDALFA